MVLSLLFAQAKVGALLKICAAETRAATIDADKDVAVLRHIRLKQAAAVRTDRPGVFYLLRTGAAVLVHNDGVFFRGVEVARLHHPAVERYTIGRRKGEELFRSNLVGHALLEFGVVNERRQRLAVSIAKRRDGGCCQIRIDVEEILEIRGKSGGIRAHLRREAARFAVLFSYIYGPAQRTFSCALVVSALRCRIVAIKSRHIVIAVCQTAQLRAVKVI